MSIGLSNGNGWGVMFLKWIFSFEVTKSGLIACSLSYDKLNFQTEIQIGFNFLMAKRDN